jgi:hypothetical protein
VPQVLVEEARYSSRPPWPAGAQGTGNSLQRIASAAFADDPANWQAAPTTAGTLNYGAFTVDSDHDGVPDELELVAGTDPLDPRDYPRLDRVSLVGTNCVLEFTAHAGRTYGVERLDGLAPANTWTLVREYGAVTDGPVTLTDPCTSAARCYRLRVSRAP